MVSGPEHANGTDRPLSPQERHQQLSTQAEELLISHGERGEWPLSTNRGIAVLYDRTPPVQVQDPKTRHLGEAFLLRNTDGIMLLFEPDAEPDEGNGRKIVYLFGVLRESDSESLEAAKWRNIANAGLAEQYLGRIKANLAAAQTSEQVSAV